jgi:hypothetical protein
MLTTRDLKLRQKEVLKNIDETYRQMIRQPVGGLGALIQKSDNPPQKRPFVPTIFTPAPMTSSLPYLADWVKQRSNETILMLSADIARQKETAKASIYYDAIKRAEYQEKLEDNMIIRNQVEPSGRDLMNRFLAGEIQKRKREEYVIETLRRNREDLALNPAIPVTPVARRPDAIGVGDLGARVSEGGAEEPTKADLNLQRLGRKTIISDLGNVAGQLLDKRLNDATTEYTLPRLNKMYLDLKTDAEKRKVIYAFPEKQLQSRPEIIREIVRAKRSGLFNIPLELPKPKITAPVAVAEEPSRAVGGGTVGGGALASILKGEV